MTWLISVQRNVIGAVQRDIVGVRFAVNVFIGTTVTWYVLTHILDDENPIWAIASMVAASDPQVKEAVRIFKSRLINVLLGCAVGLIFVVMGGSSEWKLPLALAVTVLLSSYLVQIPTMWRQAPITAAIVIAAGLTTFQAERYRTWRAQGRRGHLWLSRGPVSKFVDGEGLAGGRA
jgi:uncharacterized membrane protein YccC